MRAHHRLAALVTTTMLTASCAGTRRLDPPPAPAAVVPLVAFPAEPPPPGTGRIVIDVVDGPADVQIKSLQTVGAIWSPLCTSPCVVDLPSGPHELNFSLRSDHGRSDTDTVMVPPATSMYRRQLAQHESSPALLVGGYAVGYTGIMVLLTGLLFAAVQTSFDDGGHAGRNLALVGAAMTAGGGLMFYYGWPTEQPSAVTHVGLSSSP